MERFEEIRAKTDSAGLDAIILMDKYNRRFAAGFPSSDGAVVITASAAYFITDSRYTEAAEQSITGAEVIDIARGRRYPDLINSILTDCGAKTVGFEEESISFKTYEDYSRSLDARLCPAQSIMRDIRAVKTPKEISLLKKAQEITDEVFSQVLKIIRGDMTEKDLAAELTYRLMLCGGDKVSFDPIVVSGSNSSRPHGVPSDRRLEGFVTMDFGCVYSGYCSDMTRTVCVGAATDEMRRVYDTVLDAQMAGIQAARAGVAGSDIDKAGRQVIQAAGYGEYFGHGFGHSVGLEVHDGPGASPSNAALLPSGYVTTAEPGIYLPGKFGVRIEDVIVLNDTGSLNITKSPKHLIEIQ